MIVLFVPCLTASRDWETMQPVDEEGDFIRSPFEVLWAVKFLAVHLYKHDETRAGRACFPPVLFAHHLRRIYSSANLPQRNQTSKPM